MTLCRVAQVCPSRGQQRIRHFLKYHRSSDAAVSVCSRVTVFLWACGGGPAQAARPRGRNAEVVLPMACPSSRHCPPMAEAVNWGCH